MTVREYPQEWRGALGDWNLVHEYVTAGPHYDKGGAVFNVKHPDFGAVGDGVTDDTAAFTACATAALAVGGPIYVPPGRFNISTLTLNPTQSSVYNYAAPVVIQGSGPDSQINVTNTDGSPGLYIVLTGYFPGSIIRDLTLYGNPLCGDGLWINGGHHGVLVDNIRTLAFTKAGTGTVPIRTDPKTGVSGYAGIRLQNTIGARLTNCFADNVNTGIILEGWADGNVIANYTCYGYKRAGIDLVVGSFAGVYRTPNSVRIIEPYFYGRRSNTATESNYAAPDDDTQGLAADGSDNRRWAIKSEGSPSLHIWGGFFEASEWALFCGDYSTDLSGVGGDGAGAGAVTSVNNNNLYAVAQVVGGSYTPKVYLHNPVGGFYLQSQTFTLTIAGGTDSLNRITSSIHLRGDLDDSVTGGFRQTLDGWYQDNVPAGQAATVLQRYAGVNGEIWFAPRAGSVTGLLIRSSGARTAGTMTATVYKNGAAIALTAVLDGTNTFNKFTSASKDTYTFAAGDYLQVYLASDGSWAPTTADIRCSLEIET